MLGAATFTEGCWPASPPSEHMTSPVPATARAQSSLLDEYWEASARERQSQCFPSRSRERVLGVLYHPPILPTSVPATVISSWRCQCAGSATVPLNTLSRLPSALFAPSIDWAVQTGSNDFRVAGNRLYTTVGTTSRAYETWNHLGEVLSSYNIGAKTKKPTYVYICIYI